MSYILIYLRSREPEEDYITHVSIIIFVSKSINKKELILVNLNKWALISSKCQCSVHLIQHFIVYVSY